MQTAIVWVLVGAVLGAGAAALIAAARLRAAQAALHEDQKKVVELQATLQAERAAAGDKVALVEQARERLTESFSSLSADALRRNNDEFLRLANENLQKFREQASGDFKLTKSEIDNLVKPVSETLGKLEKQVGELENKREGAYHALTQQVKELATGQSALGKETRNLVTALRAPATRGRWGEVQLKRVAELAGMVEYCDFVEQETIECEDGRLRPDMIVKLPNDRCVVVDAKAPLLAYLEATECTDEDARQERLAQHARQVKDHMMKLASKAYWKQLGESPSSSSCSCPARASTAPPSSRTRASSSSGPTAGSSWPPPPRSSRCSTRWRTAGGRRSSPRTPSRSRGSARTCTSVS